MTITETNKSYWDVNKPKMNVLYFLFEFLQINKGMILIENNEKEFEK